MTSIRAITTPGGIAIEGQNEDDAYADMAAKRAASGLSPEQLSLQEAFSAGQRAAGFSHGASMNPYQDFTHEHAEWERGRIGASGAAVNLRLCRYFNDQPCDCGGRGVCLPAA